MALCSWRSSSHSLGNYAPIVGCGAGQSGGLDLLPVRMQFPSFLRAGKIQRMKVHLTKRHHMTRAAPSRRRELSGSKVQRQPHLVMQDRGAPAIHKYVESPHYHVAGQGASALVGFGDCGDLVQDRECLEGWGQRWKWVEGILGVGGVETTAPPHLGQREL